MLFKDLKKSSLSLATLSLCMNFKLQQLSPPSNPCLEMDRRELRLLVERYFHLGFKNQIILDFLKNHHGIPISLSTLSIFNYIRKCTSCCNNTKLENPGPARLHYLRLFFICVLPFFFAFSTLLFTVFLFKCVFSFFLICVFLFLFVFSFLFVFDPYRPPYKLPDPRPYSLKKTARQLL